MKITVTARRYLLAVDDWKAPFEVATSLGWPESAGEKVKPFLGRLISHGLVKWHPANNTYRITPAGRSALSKETGE